MQNTTLMVVGSLIAAIVLVSFASGYMFPREVTVPESVPAEVKLVQKIVCNPTKIEGNGYIMYIPSSYNLLMDIYIKSTSKNPIHIDEIRPIATGTNLPTYRTSIALSPGSVYLNSISPPWANIGSLVVTAFPGDIFVFKSGSLEQKQVGLIGKYTTSIPNNKPSPYTCPLGGRELYNLNITGTIMQTLISQPGCAPTRLKTGVFDKIFVAGKININEYYYKDWDIPFYLYLPAGVTKLGIYYRGGPNDNHGFGFISLYNGRVYNPYEYKPPHGNPFVFGYFYDKASGIEELYTDTGTSPVRTHSAGKYYFSSIDIGIARAKPARSSAPPMKFYAYYWNGRYHYIEIDYSRQTFKIIKNGRTIVSGSFVIHNPGDNVKSDLRNKGIAVIKNPTPSADTIITVKAGGTSGGTTKYQFYLPAMPNAKLDLVIAWEDLVGARPPGDRSIDGNGDEWVRVTYFNNGTWRIAGFIARGGYKHVFKLGNQTIFVKPYNTNWNNKCGSYYCEYHGHGLPRKVYMPWKEHPIETQIQLVLLKDKIITIKGLYPGDKVVVHSTHTIKTYIASGTQLTINVVKEFGLKEVFETVAGGGFTIVINPSQQHLLHLLPSSALVHVESPEHDYWIKTDVSLILDCKETIIVRSRNNIGFKANTSDYILWSANFNGKSLGVFPSIVITIQHGHVVLHSKYGDYMYNGPVKITLAPPYYVGVSRGNVKLQAIPYVYEIEVSGTEYTVVLAEGK